MAERLALGNKIKDGQSSGLRGAVGTPEQLRHFLRRYEAVGVDQLIFVMQAGNNRHEHIMEAIELFGREVMPEFQERDENQRAAKLARLQPLIDAALERREKRTPPMPEDYRITALARGMVKKLGGDAMLERIAENAALGKTNADVVLQQAPDPKSLIDKTGG